MASTTLAKAAFGESGNGTKRKSWRSAINVRFMGKAHWFCSRCAILLLTLAAWKRTNQRRAENTILQRGISPNLRSMI